MLKIYLQKLFNKDFLSQIEAEEATTAILDGAEFAQTAAFLTILKYRGEGVEEIAGMVSAIQKRAVPVVLPHAALDIVGTGGDLANTVNISTGSALLAAACGVPIAKHGNRSVSSQSGSADVLETLGIAIELSSKEVISCFEQLGIAFMYAPHFHPCLKELAPLRKALKVPTAFNLLGPLLNPARVPYALIGVADRSHLKLFSEVIIRLKLHQRVLLFHGTGLDELTTLGKISAYHIQDEKVEYLEIDPKTLGFSYCRLEELQGKDATHNALLLKKAFAGHLSALSDALILNAGAALWIFGKSPSLIEGVEHARDVHRTGRALESLEKWVQFYA